VPQSNIVAVLIVRCTHTGVYADGRPNTASVTLYDLDEITIQKNRTRAVPVPAGAGTTLPAVDIAMSTRTFVSWHTGDICVNTNLGLITSEIILQIRDKGNCGGPAGTGQALRPAVFNVERATDSLRLVIPDNVIPTVLDSIGFMVGEPITITGFSTAGVAPYRGFDGEYVISVASPGDGLAGADPGSYLIEVPLPTGAPLPAVTLAGINICLTEGRVVTQFNSVGDVGGLGPNVFGYVGGMLLPHAAGGGGTIAVFDEGVLIDAAVSTFDFIGAGVTASSAGAGAVDITIPGGGGGVTNLQEAYEGGNTIVTSTTFGDLDVSGTEAISLDASSASNFTVDGASLSLGTTTSGAVLISSAGLMDLDAVGALSINSSGGAINIGDDADTGDLNLGTGAAARSITLGNSTGATSVTVDVGTGEFALNSTVGEADPIATLTTTGANGDSIEFFVGDNDPNGSVTGLAGSLFFRDTGATGELWLNTSAGSGTTWTQVTTGAAGGATAVMYWGNSSVANSTATRVLDPGYENRIAPLASGTSFVDVRVPRAGTLRNLYVQHNNPGGTGAVITYTVFVNGVATAITVGVASTTAQGADTVNSVVVAAGDRVRIVVTKVAVAGGGSRQPEVSLEVAA
jgi:hypothetical protein